VSETLVVQDRKNEALSFLSTDSCHSLWASDLAVVSVLSSSFVRVRSCGVTQGCGVFLWFHAGAVSTADGSALVKIGNTVRQGNSPPLWLFVFQASRGSDLVERDRERERENLAGKKLKQSSQSVVLV
jgi:hypothetical protein